MVNSIVGFWALAIAVIPFASLLIPGEKILRFFAFGFLAIATAAVSIGVGFAVAANPKVSDGFASFCALLVVAAPYALIAWSCISSDGEITPPEDTPQVVTLDASARASFLKLAKVMKSVGIPRDEVQSALTTRGLQPSDADSIVTESFGTLRRAVDA